jgi:hypothetical protein
MLNPGIYYIKLTEQGECGTLGVNPYTLQVFGLALDQPKLKIQDSLDSSDLKFYPPPPDIGQGDTCDLAEEFDCSDARYYEAFEYGEYSQSQTPIRVTARLAAGFNGTLTIYQTSDRPFVPYGCTSYRSSYHYSTPPLPEEVEFTQTVVATASSVCTSGPAGDCRRYEALVSATLFGEFFVVVSSQDVSQDSRAFQLEVTQEDGTPLEGRKVLRTSYDDHDICYNIGFFSIALVPLACTDPGGDLVETSISQRTFGYGGGQGGMRCMSSPSRRASRCAGSILSKASAADRVHVAPAEASPLPSTSKQASAAPVLLGPADLSMSASPQQVAACGTLTYTLKLKVGGYQTSEDVTVTQQLPPSTTLVSCDPGPGGSFSLSGSTLSINYPSIGGAACDPQVITVTVRLDGSQPQGAALSSTAHVQGQAYRGALVTVGGPDTAAPTLGPCPQNLAVANTSPAGAAVTYIPPTASDACGAATVQCSPAPGTTFRVGTTTVSCRAIDAAGNQSSPCTFTVTVSLEQAGWKWCRKCTGLFYGPQQASSRCPADQLAHDGSISWDYSLFHTQPQFSGQVGWKWCRKCTGLFYGPQQASSRCPVSGQHDGAASWTYHLPSQQTGSVVPFPVQEQWRWCSKCKGLFYGPQQAVSRCPAGGGHDGIVSWNYRLKFRN